MLDERAADLEPRVAHALEAEGLPGRRGRRSGSRETRLTWSRSNSTSVGASTRTDLEALAQVDRRGVRPSREAHAQADVPQRAALTRPLRLEQRQLAAPRVGADQREALRALDHVHSELLGRDLGDPVALGHPERDVVERPGVHLTKFYFFRSTARCSWALFIFDRPSMFIRFASL